MIEKLGITPNWQAVDPKIVDKGTIDKLEDGQLHLWWLPLQLKPAQKGLAETLLSDLQRTKYERRTTPELKNAYLAGRYYLLQLLGAYAAINPHEVRLNYTRLNKPSLSADDQQTNHIEFNFSDTVAGNVTHGLFAFTRNGQVGVDLEARARRSNFSAIAEKKFTKQEMAFILKQNAHNNGQCEPDPERFLAIWTRKEAYGKATGLGINFKMNERNLASQKPELTFSDKDNRAWRLLQLELGDTLLASVVHAEHRALSLKAFMFK